MIRISTAGTQANPVVHLYGKGNNLDSYISVDGERVFSSIKPGEGGWKGPLMWGLGGRLRIEVKDGVGVEGVLMETVLDESSQEDAASALAASSQGNAKPDVAQPAKPVVAQSAKPVVAQPSASVRPPAVIGPSSSFFYRPPPSIAPTPSTAPAPSDFPFTTNPLHPAAPEPLSPMVPPSESDSETQCSLSQPQKPAPLVPSLPQLPPPPSHNLPIPPPAALPVAMRLFMLNCGNCMSLNRIKVLTQAVEKSPLSDRPEFTIGFVDSVAMATHLVVDSSVSKESVVAKLGYRTFEELSNYLKEKKVLIATDQWVTALTKSPGPTLPLIEDHMWQGLIIPRKSKKRRTPADSGGGWIAKKRETTANFCNFPDTTKISAASINNPIIANITAHRATAVGGGGSDGGGRAIGEQRGGVGVVKMDEGATGNDTLLPLDPPFPSISNLTAAAASADGTVIDEFQIDEETEKIIIKRCINLGVLKPLDLQQRLSPAKCLEPPLCHCEDRKPAILSSCQRKDSKHFGRTFFKCGLEDVPRQCSFMQWMDEVKSTQPSPLNHASPQRSAQKDSPAKTMAAVPVPIPKCRCAKPLPTLRRTCKSNKNGNQGRTYFSCCITNRNDKCNFFKWEDELQREVNAIVQERTGLHVRVPTPEVTTSPLITKASDPKIQAAKERRSNLTDTSKWACQRPAPHPNSLEAVSLASASTTSKVSSRNGGEGGGQGPFACNQKIANFLNDLSKAHAEGDNNPTDKWRTYNYKKASQVVQNFSLPLDKDNEENFQALGKHRGIGQKTMQKIREFAVTGKSTRLEAFKKDETRQAMSVISKVWGLGTKTAKILVNQGIKTIEDLRREFREGRVSLTDQQVIGLRVYEDLLKPIDRADIAKIGETVRKAVNELCPGTDLDIMGSYRRGALSGHDVDCLITNEKFVDNTPRNILEQLVVKLEKEGFMTDHLSMPNREKRFADQYDRSRWYKGESEDKFGSEEHALTKGVEKLPGINKNRDKQSYMGVCQLNGVHKRIDIKFYPRYQLPFAQLYFTGNAYFNRSMRLYAKTVGYSLSDDGLFETMRKRINGESHVVSQGPSLPAKTEEDIFKLMGLVYVAPKDRNAYDAVVTAKLDGLDVEKEELSQDVRELEFDGDLGGSQSFWAEEGRQGKALEGSECDSDFGDFWNDNAKYQYANPEA